MNGTKRLNSIDGKGNAVIGNGMGGEEIGSTYGPLLLMTVRESETDGRYEVRRAYVYAC